jgi:prepilin-type N-terminal cleavage/methylation domain-containing protein
MLKTRRSQGFTLVEMAVAIVVSSVALMATASAVVEGARLSRLASETRAAMRCTQSMMERVRATPYAQITNTFSNRTLNMSAIAAVESTGTCATAVTAIPTGNAKWTVLLVTVTTSWNGVNGPASQTMSTYVCDRTNGAVQ